MPTIRPFRPLLFVIPTLLLSTSLAAVAFTDPIHRTGMEVFTCPNGIIEDTEQCDDNNATAGDMCAPNCRLFNCGDTVLDTPYEECDDGNQIAGDGCDGQFCFIEYGLYFSEYLEGSSNNKALEIKNPSPDWYDMDANNCYVLRYNNGVTIPSDVLALGPNVPNYPGFPGTTIVSAGPSVIAPGDVFTMANPSAVPEILAVSDHNGTIAFFNGDDAMALECGGTLIDIIGVIGQDPGVNWPVGAGFTSEFTLVRRCRVRGETDWAVSSSGQWEVNPQNDVSLLGSGSCNP